jgi:hypothetical protein
MRSISRLVLVVLAVAGGFSCDSDDPLTRGSGIAQIYIQGVALRHVYDVQVRKQDLNDDGVPDNNSDPLPPLDPVVGAICTQVLNDTGAPLLSEGIAPWPYSAEISVLRAGTTAPVVLATSIGSPDVFGSISLDYDPDLIPLDPLPPEGSFYYNGFRVTTASRLYLQYCLGVPNLPEPNILGEPYPFEVSVNSGDTVLVKARKELQTSAPFVLGSEPRLIGIIRLDGTTVQTTGTTVSTDAPGSGLSFSYTVR